MKIKEIKKIISLVSLVILLVGSLYGIDKWVDSKITEHAVVVVNRKWVNDNENEIMKTKEHIMELDKAIIELKIRIENLLMEEYYP